MLPVSGWVNLGRGLSVILSELLFSHNNSTWSLLGAGYQLLWPVCAGLMVLGWARRPGGTTLLFLTTAVVGTIGFYLLIYLLRPYFSIERYLMHAAPLAVVAAGWVIDPGSKHDFRKLTPSVMKL